MKLYSHDPCPFRFFLYLNAIHILSTKPGAGFISYYHENVCLVSSPQVTHTYLSKFHRELMYDSSLLLFVKARYIYTIQTNHPRRIKVIMLSELPGSKTYSKKHLRMTKS